MKTLGTNSLKILKILHLSSTFMWIGGALSMMLLIVGIIPTESHEMYMHSLSLKMIDDWLIIIGAYGCIITGLIYSIFTKWGFVKHRWIAVKWILTIFMVLSGTFMMGPRVNGNVYTPENISLYSTANSTFWDNITQVKYWGILQLVLLITVVIISVYKPWKKVSSRKEQKG